MKKIVFALAASGLMLTACKEKNQEDMNNPFLQEYTTPYQIPPFDQIKNVHFEPAFTKAIEEHNKEIDAIINNSEAPTFENTIAKMDYSGALIKKVAVVFYNYLSANTSEELQGIAEKVSPLLTAHSDNINLNPKLFARVKAVYEQKENLSLNEEQTMLLENTYKNFVRGGADLAEDKQERFRAINEKLSLLSLKFGNNILDETNDFQLVIENKEELAGLPESVIAAAAQEAQSRDLKDKWVFTLHAPSYGPFMQYSSNRALREKMFKAYIERGNHNDEKDNKAILTELAELRAEKAQLLGYANHAAYVLEESMAKTPEQVNNMLTKLWKATLPVVAKEQAELQKVVQAEGNNFQLEGWDWAYYAEKLRKQAYDFDEEAFRPYLSLDKVTEGVFLACKNLFGLEFVKRTDLPTYHPEAVPYEVKEADGKFVGIIYMDFFPRASKRGGAWMSDFREQSIDEKGNFVHPIITIVCNFSKPTGDTPALLNFDEVITYFHEFGHALHGLLSNVQYPSLSGTNVPRDFVELPSQIFENWSTEPTFLKTFAKHYQTGEVIPDELIEKYLSTSKFNQGYATTEYLAASILDMNLHTISADQKIGDVSKFEQDAMSKINLTTAIPPRYRSTYFNHIFAGGYSAGYYSYIWSEMLDADAFDLFKQKGIFDAATALSFRKNILEKGGSVEPMKLYKQFRGQEPTIDALLKRRGLNHTEIVQTKQ